jgi:2'-5' RNA ligase
MEEMDAADILLQVSGFKIHALYDAATDNESIRDLQGEGIGTFSRASGRGPSTISVVWGRLKHESDKRVREVHAAVERACSRANGSAPRQDPRFHPHVTLARVKTMKNTTSEEMMHLAEFAEGLVQGECQGAGEFECRVAGVSLMEVKFGVA